MASLKTLVSFLALALVLFPLCEAKKILVGGKEFAWSTPNASDYFNQWAKNHRFKVGDFLIFKYDGKVDSVLQVTKENYDSCNTTNPIKEYKDDKKTKVELEAPGPLYFISGADGHCQKGQKVEVIVMSEKHHVPALSPKQADAPAPAPAKNSSKAYGRKSGCFLDLVPFLVFAFVFIFV